MTTQEELQEIPCNFVCEGEKCFYFLEDYKEKVYSGSRRKVIWYEKVMFAALLISLALYLLPYSLKWNAIVAIVSFSILILSFIIIFIYSDMSFRRNRRVLLDRYKTKHVALLINLLNSYNLYTDDGLTWLVDCCNGKKKKGETFVAKFKLIEDLFISSNCPIIMLCLGLVLAESSRCEIYSFLGGVIAMFLIVVLACICLRSIISFMIFPGKYIIDYLDDDLKYVITQRN